MKTASPSITAEPSAPVPHVEISADAYLKGNHFTADWAVLARITANGSGRPFVELNTFLGYGAEMTPARARELGRKLIAIADAAEQLPKSQRPSHRRY